MDSALIGFVGVIAGILAGGGVQALAGATAGATHASRRPCYSPTSRWRGTHSSRSSTSGPPPTVASNGSSMSGLPSAELSQPASRHSPSIRSRLRSRCSSGLSKRLGLGEPLSDPLSNLDVIGNLDVGAARLWMASGMKGAVPNPPLKPTLPGTDTAHEGTAGGSC